MKTLIAILLGSAALMAASPEMQTYMQQLQSQANKPFDAARGEAIFTSEHIGKKGEKISCTSCHGANLATAGKNVHTGKVIEALSPKANPTRLSSVKEVKKWLRRNFNDVYNREGTPQEKGDVLTYIMNH
jgi:mono/diheme cytochrome c family protein